jgi:hypothetical protein
VLLACLCASPTATFLQLQAPAALGYEPTLKLFLCEVSRVAFTLLRNPPLYSREAVTRRPYRRGNVVVVVVFGCMVRVTSHACMWLSVMDWRQGGGDPRPCACSMRLLCSCGHV